MKITILKTCTTPEGSHQPGATVETETRCAEYLISNGYAKPFGKESVAIETAEAPLQARESATIPTKKFKR
jgi:hypothetical protein